ncbi:MAG: hypothetical protein ISS50_09510 [Anaerolineae bacterium]|nr:hypothetical protein [Anaerolineae bacterium]
MLPIHAEPSRWGWLGLSAIIGLVLGDAMLFQAFVLDWIFKERITQRAIARTVVAMVGVAMIFWT